MQTFFIYIYNNFANILIKFENYLNAKKCFQNQHPTQSPHLSDKYLTDTRDQVQSTIAFQIFIISLRRQLGIGEYLRIFLYI